jgi:hypothetical protein
MRIRLLLIGAVTLGALSFVGCSDSEDGGPQPAQDFKTRGMRDPAKDGTRSRPAAVASSTPGHGPAKK